MKQILTEQLLKMQKLAGIITESEYREKLDELSPETVKAAYDKSKSIGQTGRTNIMTKGAAIYKAEEDEKTKAAIMKQKEEAERAIEPVKEFIDKPYTVYTITNTFRDDDGTILNIDALKYTDKICKDCLYKNKNDHFAIRVKDYFIYNEEEDNFIIDSDDLLGVDRATALLLIQFAKKINPSSTLTAQNLKIKGKDKPLPVFGIHFNDKQYGDIDLNIEN